MARFPRDRVRIEGRSQTFVRVGDSGKPSTLHFCPNCGSTVYWEMSSLPDFLAIAYGAFADARLPAPMVSVYEEFAHKWAIPQIDGIEHRD